MNFNSRCRLQAWGNLGKQGCLLCEPETGDSPYFYNKSHMMKCTKGIWHGWPRLHLNFFRGEKIYKLSQMKNLIQLNIITHKLYNLDIYYAPKNWIKLPYILNNNHLALNHSWNHFNCTVSAPNGCGVAYYSPYQYPFTPGWWEAITVMCLAPKHKCFTTSNFTKLLKH